MKKHGLKIAIMLGSSVLLGTTACGSADSEIPVVPVQFSFTLKFETRGTTNKLYVGDVDRLVAVPTIVDEGRTYEFSSNNEDAVSINKNTGDFTVHAVPDNAKHTVRLSAKETKSGKTAGLTLTIAPKPTKFDGGKNYSDDNTEKTKIIGALEEYAMKNFLTGMPLFENGGWIRYSSRVDLPVTNYISGYGFGLLREGRLTAVNTKVPSEYGSLLLSSMTSDPSTINAWTAQGSQVSDLNGYITSSFWGTKLSSNKKGYDWYSILATRNEPEAIYEEENAKGLYNTWRVYLHVGEDKNGNPISKENGGIFYRSATSTQYDGMPIRAMDYMFAFKNLLNGTSDTIRGNELATDTSYGFRGANQFNKATKGLSAAAIDQKFNQWTGIEEHADNGKLGIKLGWASDTEPYIDFTFINAIDQFTAKYTLSSNLYSPLPQSYLEWLAGSLGLSGWPQASKKYGTISGVSIPAHVLNVGPFFLSKWASNEVVFLRNDEWYEVNSTTYRIPGVMMTVLDPTADSDIVFNTFNTGILDSTGIPKSHIEEAGKGDPTTGAKDYETVGDSTFKLNVNAATQTRWNELFGPSGTVKPGVEYYSCKPWMSNFNFLKGLFWSIDRKTFAANRGVKPSVNYFADTYLSDPTNPDPTKRSYNNTEYHAAALRSFGIDPTDGKYGYDENNAKSYFRTAIRELIDGGKIDVGTPSNPTTIEIDIWWMSSTDPKEYGIDIAYYMEKAFNAVGTSFGVNLKVNNPYVTLWEEVYDQHLQIGRFDLGFGAISGNTLNPLNFLEVLKSNNSSGFTLNWGADTSKVDDNNPIVYDGCSWSYDALWAAGDHGVIATGGEETKAVNECYLTNPVDPSTEEILVGGDLRNGGRVRVPTVFAKVEGLGIEFKVEKIQLNILGSEGLEITGEDIIKVLDGQGNVEELKFDLSLGVCEQINDDLFNLQSVQVLYTQLRNQYIGHYDDPDYLRKEDELKHLFTYGNYGIYWDVDVHYSYVIGGGNTVENFITAAKSKDQQPTRALSAHFAQK